jgi:hypothetical protein
MEGCYRNIDKTAFLNEAGKVSGRGGFAIKAEHIAFGSLAESGAMLMPIRFGESFYR